MEMSERYFSWMSFSCASKKLIDALNLFSISSLHKFTIAYGEVKAVKELTVQFPEGITGLLGVNGAGKSSLIKGLLGLVPIHSGEAKILGRSVHQEQKAIRQLIQLSGQHLEGLPRNRSIDMMIPVMPPVAGPVDPIGAINLMPIE